MIVALLFLQLWLQISISMSQMQFTIFQLSCFSWIANFQFENAHVSDCRRRAYRFLCHGHAIRCLVFAFTTCCYHFCQNYIPSNEVLEKNLPTAPRPKLKTCELLEGRILPLWFFTIKLLFKVDSKIVTKNKLFI